MAEYIKKEDVLSLADRLKYVKNSDVYDGIQCVLLAVEEMESEDVEHVVHCKDCEDYVQSAFIDKHMVCKLSNMNAKPDGFCSYGMCYSSDDYLTRDCR